MATPILTLPTVPNGQTNLSVAFNEAMQKIDVFLLLVVEDKDLTTPPTTLDGDVGKRWIVAASATGAWAGQEGKIALCTGPDVWAFFSAPTRIIAWVEDEGAEYRRTPTAWALV